MAEKHAPNTNAELLEVIRELRRAIEAAAGLIAGNMLVDDPKSNPAADAAKALKDGCPAFRIGRFFIVCGK